MISSVMTTCQNEWTYFMGCCAFCWVRRNLRWQTLVFAACWFNLRGIWWGQCRWWGIQGVTVGQLVLSEKSHGENILEWGNICIYRTRCRSDGKNQKNVIARSMGDVWLVCGLFGGIGMLLRRNEHVVMLVPNSGLLPPWVYHYGNRSKSTGGLEELVAYYCANLDFQLAENEHY